jgi:hypothetical protein
MLAGAQNCSEGIEKRASPPLSRRVNERTISDALVETGWVPEVGFSSVIIEKFQHLVDL